MINRMSRRGFLTVVLGAIASKTLLTSTAVADAIEQFGAEITTETGNPDKIAESVRRARALLTLDKTTERERICVDGNSLMSFMLDHFDERLLTFEQTRTLFTDPASLGLDTSVLSEEALAALVDGMIPLAVFKHLLRPHMLPFDVRNMEAMGRFSFYYGDRISGRRSARLTIVKLIAPKGDVSENLLHHTEVPLMVGMVEGIGANSSPAVVALIQLINTARSLAKLDASNLAEMERQRIAFRDLVTLHFPDATRPNAVNLYRDSKKLEALLDGVNTEGAIQLAMQVLPLKLAAQLEAAGFSTAHTARRLSPTEIEAARNPGGLAEVPQAMRFLGRLLWQTNGLFRFAPDAPTQAPEVTMAVAQAVPVAVIEHGQMLDASVEQRITAEKVPQ